MFKIERGMQGAARITGASGRPGGRRYPFHTMQPGDGFTAPPEDAAKAIEAAKKWRQRHSGWEHAWAREADGSLRLWRTE